MKSARSFVRFVGFSLVFWFGVSIPSPGSAAEPGEETASVETAPAIPGCGSMLFAEPFDDAAFLQQERCGRFEVLRQQPEATAQRRGPVGRHAGEFV